MRKGWAWALIGTSILLVSPFYDYPVGDDWTYALSVKHLLETGRLRLVDESAASIVFHVLWGALFCLPVGFSFSALHLATLVLGLAGVWAFARLCALRIAEESGAESASQASCSRPSAFPLLAALALWFNPIFFTLSFTFFTDVPFVALSLLAIYFFSRSRVEEEEPRARVALAWGTLCATAAALVRQYAILIPIAFALSCVGEKPWRARWFALGIPLGATVAFYVWIIVDHGVPTQFHFAQVEMLKTYRVARDLWHLPPIAALYLGAFALPLVAAMRGTPHTSERWRPFVREGGGRGRAPATILILLGGYAVWAFVTERRTMPYLTDSALMPSFGSKGGLILTGLSVGSAALMLTALVRESRAPWAAVLRARARALRIVAGLLVALALLLTLGIGRDSLVGMIERALIAYYHAYTSAVPSNRGLEYWRQRVEDFYLGVRGIAWGLAVFGLFLALWATWERGGHPRGTLWGLRSRSSDRLGTLSGDPSEGGSVASAWMTRFLGILLFLFLGFFILISCRFDRYLLILFPLAVALGARPMARSLRPAVASVLLVGMAALSIASAKTRIAGARAVWEAGRQLLARGVPIEEINLDYTFNAWMLYMHGRRQIERTGQPSYWVYAARRDFRYWGWPPDEPADVVLEVPYRNFLTGKIEAVRVWRVRR